MKKLMFWMALCTLSLGLITLAACGGNKDNGGGGNTETYAYTQTADDGVTVTAVQGDATVENGGTVASDKDLTVTATAAGGKVELYVNDAFQESPYTFTPTEDVSVRAELYYTVTVKIENPNKIVGRNITLKQDDNRVTLPATLQYLASVRAGKTVTFTASSAGYRDAAATVVADGDKTVTLTLDQFRMEGAAYSNVTETEGENGTEYRMNAYETGGQYLNPYVYKGCSETNWVMSFKVKDIETGDDDSRYGIVSVGAVISYKSDGDYIIMALHYAPIGGIFYGAQIISFYNWGILHYEFNSNIDAQKVVKDVLDGSDDSFELEFVRNGEFVYMFVDGTYCTQVDLSEIPNPVTSHENSATAFGLFSRVSDCTIFDLKTSLGEDAAAARLEKDRISLPAASGTNGHVTFSVPQPANVYETEKNVTYTTLGAGDKVFKGQEIVAELVPEENYMFKSLTYGGEDVSAQVRDSKYTFYADADKALVATFEPVPNTVTGNIDVKTYRQQIPSTAIHATASNGQSVTIDNYTYSVPAAIGTNLTLTFTVDGSTAEKGFASVTKTFDVSGETGESVVIDEPVLKTWAESFTKTGHNEYTVAADTVAVYNSTDFLSVSTKYFVIESKVTITTPTADYGFGFKVYGQAAIDIALTGGVWYSEIICNFTDATPWVIQRQPLSAALSEKMTAAAAGTPVVLKAVRASNVLAIFIDNEYAGSFLTSEFANVPALLSNEATDVGLYERGGAAGKFAEVWYNLDQANAEGIVNGLQAVKGDNQALALSGLTWQGDNLVSDGTTDQFATAVMTTPSKVYKIETTISGVSAKNAWGGVYIGFMTHWDHSSIELIHDTNASKIGIEAFNGDQKWAQKLLDIEEDVDINAKLTALLAGGTLKLTLVRYYDTWYVYVDDVLAATAVGADFADAARSDAGDQFGFEVRGLTACTLSNISYSADRLAVLDYLKNA